MASTRRQSKRHLFSTLKFEIDAKRHRSNGSGGPINCQRNWAKPKNWSICSIASSPSEPAAAVPRGPDLFERIDIC